MTPEQLDDLRAKAEEATKGEWHEGERWVFVNPRDGNATSALDHILRDVPELQENCAYIVAAQPQVVIGLLDRIAELEKALEPFAALVKSLDDAGIAFLRSDQAEASARMTDTELAEMFAPSNEVALTDGAMRSPVKITWGDFRLARTTLTRSKS